MTPDEIKWLTWGALQVRPSGSTKWDATGTATIIAEHCGSWSLAMALEHVIAHARDPEAKTPGRIRQNWAPDTTPQKTPMKPPKPEDMCPVHGGWLNSCSGCAADKLAGDPTPDLDRHQTVSVAKYADQIRAELSERKGA